jgi:uncharacterized lipoprotein YddW (UPF0748 family)
MKQPYSKLLFFIFIGLSLLKSNEINAQCITGSEFNNSTPKRDMRGVFLPSVFSISWPSDRNATPAVQQAELIAILDDVKANSYNSVFLQVRPECDALYDSTIEPWSYWLTGTQGTAPSPLWDPLQFAVDEAHTRGLDLHAWLNPYRSKRAVYTRASNHVSILHPDWVFTASNNASIEIMDPGLPDVENYIVSVVEDIATRYDVDGIHFDDYFYPSGGMTNNQDAQTYIDHNPTNIATLEDWRRDNVNQMIAAVYDAIQTINTNNNKSITFGVSPFGIWKNGVPSGTTGTSSYDALFCDPIAWMQAGKVDYIAPQVYWDLNSSGQDYNLLTQWWNDQADTYNTQVYVSQAYYKMLSPQNWPASEIQGQIDFNRNASMDATFGQIGYRYNEIDTNTNGINGALNGAQFQYPSYAPPITGTGKDAICALNPDNIRFGPLKIMWDTPVAASDGDVPAKYVVYVFNNAAEATTNLNDGSKILDIVAGNELAITQVQIDTKFLVVTSLDKNNNEAGDFCNFPLTDITAPCSVASITPPTAKNNCTGSFTGTTSTVFPIESTTVVTWTYDFGGGNTFTQNQNLIITDVTPPNVVTQNITVILTGATITITANDVDNGSSDNCSIQSMSIDVDTFACADLGIQPVILTVVDSNGNSASATAMVTVVGNPTTYSAGTWDNGAPTFGSSARFSGDYNTATDGGSIDACSCEVDATRTLTVAGGDYLNIESDITVNGTLIVEHQGSVVQTDNNALVTNNGTINVLLSTPNLASRDFMILGSPMTGETRGSVWSSAFLVLDHNTLNFVPNPAVAIAFPGAENFADDNYDNWIVYNNAGTVDPGEGYLVRPQAGYGQPGGVFNYTYDGGTLHNGIVNFSVLYNTPGPTSADDKNASPNVLANPFPSAIFADDFIGANAMIDEVFFWEHLTPPSPGLPGAGSMNFSMEDISMYNLSGGVPAASDPGTTTTPNGYISTGQGFGIKATAAGTATFTNSMRRTTNNNTLRDSNDKDRVWISVNNARYEMQNTTLIAFTQNATSGLDNGYDSRRLATVVSLYSHLEDGSEELGIQSREAFESGVKIPLGFSTQIEAELEFEISISNIEGENLESATLYLIDNYTNEVTNLSEGAYSFKSNKGTFHNRFTLQFEKEPILGTPDNELETLFLFPNPTMGLLNIKSEQNPIIGIIVYDVQGRKVTEIAVNSERNYTIDISEFEAGVYFINITDENRTITKRVIKK